QVGVGHVLREAQGVGQGAARAPGAEPARHPAGADALHERLRPHESVAEPDPVVVDLEPGDHAVAVEDVLDRPGAYREPARADAVERTAQAGRDRAVEMMDPIVVLTQLTVPGGRRRRCRGTAEPMRRTWGECFNHQACSGSDRLDAGARVVPCPPSTPST